MPYSMKTLYICSTYYHALITIIKALCSSTPVDILIMHYIPGGRAFADRLRNYSIFGKVYYTDPVKEYSSNGWIDKLFFMHRKNAETVAAQYDGELLSYDEIYLFHEDTWAAHYLQDKKKKYNLIEDCLDCYKNINKSDFRYLYTSIKPKVMCKNFLRYGYTYCGDSPAVKSVEVNDKNSVKILNKNKIIEVSRRQLFDSVTQENRVLLLEVFQMDCIKMKIGKSLLLLTQPLENCGLVKSKEEQINVYRKLILENRDKEYNLYIKPHPRDYIDYTLAFPEAIIIKREVPSELLNFCDDVFFDKGICLFSTSINGISCIDKKISKGNYFDVKKYVHAAALINGELNV